MPDSTQGAVLLLRAQTELHPGGGQPFGAIDLAVQREVHTNWPMIQSTGIKGVLRDRYRDYLVAEGKGAYNRKTADADKALCRIFGGEPGKEERGEAGALLVTDAAILAFPVASSRGAFAWVTCASVVERLRRALVLAGVANAGLPATLGGLGVGRARVTKEGTGLLMPSGAGNDSQVVLRDISCGVDNDESQRQPLDQLANWIAKYAPQFDANAQPPYGLFDPRARLVQVSDDVFTYLVRFGTHVVTRNALEIETRTVAGGALFTQELLPAETLLYSVLMSQARQEQAAALSEIDGALSSGWLQIGANESTGKGIAWAELRRASEF